MMLSRFQLILFGLFVLIFSTSCGGENGSTVPSTEDLPPTITKVAAPVTNTPEPPTPTRLNLAFGSLPASLDPHRTSDRVASEILRIMCQELTWFEDSPLLATGWEYNDDSTSLTMFLRQDVQFRDGTPFTSEAVKYSFERLQVPEAEDSPLFETFEGVQFETPDAHTIVFNFDSARADFVEKLNTGYAVILSPSADESTIATDPVCIGAYHVANWQPGEFILLSKNETFNTAPTDFANQGPAYIDEIKIFLIDSHERRIEALLNGIIDTNHINTQAELAIIKENSDEFRIAQGAWLGGITYLGFNYASSPTDELLVRQALAHAVDKNALIDAVLADDFANPAVSLLPPNSLGYTESLKGVEFGFDLETSRRLLTEAGFTDSDGDGILDRNGESLTLKMITTTDNINFKMATEIQTWFAEIGVSVEIQQNTPSEIREITPTGEFDLLLYDYNWPAPSALNLFLSTEKIGTTNRVFYSNENVDALLAEISSLGSDPANEALVEAKAIEAQSIIIQDSPWQPILARRVVTAVNVRVVGEDAHNSGRMIWHDASIIDPSE